MTDFSGEWHSAYRYPSSGRGADFWSNHVLVATQDTANLHLESDAGNLSRVMMELVCDFAARTATGTWYEKTNPEGYYEGREYTGTVAFTIAPDGTRFDGVWQGQDSGGVERSDVWYLSRQPFTDAHQVIREHSDG